MQNTITPAATQPTTRPGRRPRRFRNPWGVDLATARRYGYPLPAPTPIEELEDRVAALEDAQALRDGLALLGGAR